MNWFYESAGQQQGPVSESSLDELLASGAVTPETRVWNETMADWQPLRIARPPAAPSLEPTESSSTDPDATPLPPGHVRCNLTGNAIPESEAIYIQGRPYSADAKLRVLQTIQQGRSLPELEHERIGPAWEQRDVLGFFPALWKTTKNVLLKPSATFATMKRAGGISGPLLFSAILGFIGVLLGTLYNILGNAIAGQVGFTPEGPIDTMVRDLTIGKPESALFQVGFLLVSPLIIILANFFNAGLTHLLLMLVGAARHPFEVTFRVNCYAGGSTSAFALVPVIGSLVAIPWFLVVACIGLARAQGISLRQACFATLMPFVLCIAVVSIALVGLALATRAAFTAG